MSVWQWIEVRILNTWQIVKMIQSATRTKRGNIQSFVLGNTFRFDFFKLILLKFWIRNKKYPTRVSKDRKWWFIFFVEPYSKWYWNYNLILINVKKITFFIVFSIFLDHEKKLIREKRLVIFPFKIMNF